MELIPTSIPAFQLHKWILITLYCLHEVEKYIYAIDQKDNARDSSVDFFIIIITSSLFILERIIKPF